MGRTSRMSLAGSALAVCLAVWSAGCGESLPEVEGDSATSMAIKGINGVEEALSWRFEAPPSWDERVRIVEDPDGADRLAEEGIHAARLFEYLPHDTTIVPQTLLGVYVYDSTVWARLEAEGGPPQGDLVMRGPGVAYVVGFPQSNPFAPGTADSVEFDKRTVTMDYVKKAFRVVR